MRLDHRLRRLEQHSRVVAGARPCPECGGPVDWRAWQRSPGEVDIHVFHADVEVSGPDKCPACGRRW